MEINSIVDIEHDEQFWIYKRSHKLLLKTINLTEYDSGYQGGMTDTAGIRKEFTVRGDELCEKT